MLMKTNVEKMSAYRPLAMLMKTIELKSLSRDVDEIKGAWLKPEVEHPKDGVRQRPLWFCPRMASAVRRCGRPATFGGPRRGFGPRTAPEGSLTFHLTKPRAVGIVNRQVGVRDEKALCRACHSPASSASWDFNSNKMSLPETGLPKKMLTQFVRSRYVYENKGNIDKMTVEESDIYSDMT